MQIEMSIKGLMVDPITNTPIVILRDKEGQKVLPIWVGIFEANAIALQIENISTPRPMTHDLLRNVIHDLKATVQKIVVCDLQENTFYALIYLSLNGDTLAIDARPSDAIALALRTRAPIFVEDSVIDNAKTVDFTPDKADSDPQANSTMSFLDIAQVTRSVYDAVQDGQANLADVIVPSPLENLWVAPSRIALAKLESKLVGELDAHFRLKDKLAPILRDYPHIVIDCPPTLGLLTVNALVAATHLLIPIQSSYFALEGTDDLLETIEKVRARPNPALRILGVVITMHDKRTALARDIRAQIQKVFGGKVFKTVITKSVRLEESPAYKESIFTFAPESTGATEYYSLCEEVIDRA